ncbi:MAG TPA: FCD domain-containing protein [Streptosporangiaceae bacterium]|nr:FCD domain-containing protein [Streptosporangiaceae bacterium]
MRTAAEGAVGTSGAGSAAGAGGTGAGGAGVGGTADEHGHRLAGLILAESERAGLGPGSRLPTERQLALDLGVTRSSVRHALALLEAQGRISREVGRGTFLREPVPAAVVPAGGGVAAGGSPGGDFAPADVMMVRRLLEPPAMPLVVAWATAADLDDMDHCLAGGDHAASYEEFETWDLALHRCIMRASRSPLLAVLYGVIEQARHGHVWGDLKRRSASATRRQEYQADHRQIVAALRARDSAAAVEAMRVHLARVSNDLHATDPAAAVTWQ